MSSESRGSPRPAASGAGSSAPARFERVFFGARARPTRIGEGEIGGKARGLLVVSEVLESHLDHLARNGLEVGIPAMTVLTTGVFDAFMERNVLGDVAGSDLPDDRMSLAFQRADLPAEIVGDLRALTEETRSPLAIRSSSRLEDAMFRPFAGVYATKMVPNNQPDPDLRFRALVEAVKYVYASTFFPSAKAYRRSIGARDADESMAVLVQEVVGLRHFDRFYPDISGVARAYNWYPLEPSAREEGVVALALGLGKTIVDGGVTWSYSPARPRVPPPFASPADLLRHTQTTFWAVNLEPLREFDPTRETEYLVSAGLREAELDGSLRYTASTYVAESDRLVPGTAHPGPRALTFSPVLEVGQWPINELVRELLAVCGEAMGAPAEIEFAITFDSPGGPPARLAFLQARPLVVPSTEIRIDSGEMIAPGTVVASERVMGHGIVDSIRDIVYVKPDGYDPSRNPAIAKEAETLNRRLLDADRGYLLVGFGRWGSSEPWLGCPVTWGQICGARAIVEASLPDLPGDLSQGSHFFHNITSSGVPYFMVRHERGGRIDWDWLESLPAVDETENLRHVAVAAPLAAKVDGKTGRGIVRH